MLERTVFNAGEEPTVFLPEKLRHNLVVLWVLSTEPLNNSKPPSLLKNRCASFKNRHADGVDTYLKVVTSQTTAPVNERNSIDLLRRRLEANVLLIKAMGGGWTVSNLPKT